MATPSAFGQSSGGWSGFSGSSGSVPSGQLWLSGAGGWPSTTAGCAVNTKTETGNKVNYYTLDFDPNTAENAEWACVMPSDWDGGTITATFYWVPGPYATYFGVTWQLQATSFPNASTLDVAYSNAQQVADTGADIGYIYKSDPTPAITVAGTPAGGAYTQFRVQRLVDDPGDTMDWDARLLGVMIAYTRA